MQKHRGRAKSEQEQLLCEKQTVPLNYETKKCLSVDHSMISVTTVFELVCIPVSGHSQISSINFGKMS